MTYNVVHCKTQEEWDFVLEKNKKLAVVTKSTFNSYKENSCFNLDNGCYSGLPFFKSNNSLILSFQEWCDKFGHINPFIKNTYKFKVGDEVKIIANESSSCNEIGDIGIIKSFHKGNNPSAEVEVDGRSTLGNHHYLTDLELIETTKEISKEPSKEEELLAYARKHYPIGTQFIPAHTGTGLDEVTENTHRFESEGKSTIIVDKKHISGENWAGCLYIHGKWAEIVSKPKEITEDKPQFIVGKWYKLEIPWYIKFKEIDDTNIILSTDYIDNDKRFVKSNKGTFGKVGSHILTECSLEEIQQYLPEGHVDKIVKSDTWIPQVGEYAIMVEAGGWSFSHENNGCLAIIEKVDPPYGVYGYYISGKLINPKTESYITFSRIPISTKYPNKIICRKALSHEIILPESKQESKWVPKIGDWVFIDNQYGSSLSLDIPHKLTKVNHDHYFINGSIFYRNQLRKALDHEIPKHSLQDAVDKFNTQSEKDLSKRKPKIGDYVVVTQPGFITGEIDRLKSKNTYNGNYWELEKHENVFSYKDDQFRFATDAEIKAELDKGNISISDYLTVLEQEPIINISKLDYDFKESTSNKILQLLQPKEDKRFNTSVNKIESVKIQLKQKSKSIKF